MGTRHWTALALGLVACSPDPGAPFWALDPIALYPEGDGVEGIQTWELFGEKWGRRFAEKWYVCSVVVEFEGTATDLCEGCTHAWDVTPTVAESDCPEGTADDPHFVGLTHVGLGGGPPDVDAKDPHPGDTSGAWADYGDGWLSYGWAYAEALDHDEDGPATWDGTAPFALWPAWAWEM